LITQVETTISSIHDVKMTENIQNDLIKRNIKPETQIVDQGYVEFELLMRSLKKGIDLVGRVASCKNWQSKVEGAFDHDQFKVDWEQEQAKFQNRIVGPANSAQNVLDPSIRAAL